MSTVTADMSDNSDAADTTGLALLPMVPVAWSATQGTMNPTSGTITSDMASSTFTSTSGSNGTACGMVDNELTCTGLTVTAPSFTIDDVTHNEGNAGTTSYTFTVTKTGSTALDASVDWQTQDGTATTANNDYQPDGDTLVFGPGVTTRQITVLVNGDTQPAPNETFTVHLSNAVNATITDADGTGTITNDDGAFSINDVTMNEGNAGQTSFVFTVTKSGDNGSGSSVNFTTQDGTAKVANGDYQANSGTLNFGPTDTSMQITVLVNGDITPEPDETFTVHLSGATNAGISDADGLGTITNDDGPPQIVYVDDDWSSVPNGDDPDGAGPATAMGFDAFTTIGAGVNAVANPGTVIVYPGTYTENVTTTKTLSLRGARFGVDARGRVVGRSEEHTSELQSR